MRADAGPDRAYVRVESSDRDHGLARQAEPRCPFPRESAERSVGGERLAAEARLQCRQTRVESRQELVGWIPAVVGVPHRLVAGGASAPPHRRQVRAAGQHRRHPVAVLQDRAGRLRDCRVLPQDVERLRPEPFRRVDPAHVPGEVGAAPTPGEAVDLLRLRHRGVVLPEKEHRVRVLLEAGPERERPTPLVGEDRARAGGVHRDAPDPPAGAPARFLERFDQRGLHRLEIVERVLPEPVLDRIAEQALLPAGVVLDARGHEGAVPGAHHDAPDGVRSEVDPHHKAVGVSHALTTTPSATRAALMIVCWVA